MSCCLEGTEHQEQQVGRNTPGRMNEKWYSVVVGRMTGVFNDWHFTESLIIRVPGQNFKGHKTELAAQEVYSDAKRRGIVKVVRTSFADDGVFGPAEEAADCNWRGY